HLKMRSHWRFLSNAFLPIGLIFIFIIIDDTLQNTILNSIFVLLIIGIAYVRKKVGLIDDKRLLKNSTNL
ncbi:MAG: hypothetical protein ACFFDN_36535, partial [Candidatus Hodarchaeota archaeon]